MTPRATAGFSVVEGPLISLNWTSSFALSLEEGLKEGWNSPRAVCVSDWGVGAFKSPIASGPFLVFSEVGFSTVPAFGFLLYPSVVVVAISLAVVALGGASKRLVFVKGTISVEQYDGLKSDVLNGVGACECEYHGSVYFVGEVFGARHLFWDWGKGQWGVVAWIWVDLALPASVGGSPMSVGMLWTMNLVILLLPLILAGVRPKEFRASVVSMWYFRAASVSELIWVSKMMMV